MAEIYFRNEKTGRRYKVVQWNQETGEIILKGEYAEFAEKYSKERFQRMGYVIEKGDADAKQRELQT